jgi:hypothetical protein
MLRPMLPLPERRGNTSILPKKKKLQQKSIIKNNAISKKVMKQDDKDNNNNNNDLKKKKILSMNDNNINVDNTNTIRNRITLYNLYKGNHIEIEPNDELKQLRKSLGIIIKGKLIICACLFLLSLSLSSS